MMLSTRGSFIPALAGFVALALTLAWATPARASLYSYAQQQTSGYVVSGATLGPISPNSSSSSAQIASPTGFDSHVGTTDTLESYVGPPLKPGENSFVPKGTTNPDYSRGDALVTLAPAFSTNNVAETFLGGTGNAQGAGGWSASSTLTVPAGAGPASITFQYSNSLIVTEAGAPTGTVQATYSYNLNLQDTAGNIVFSTSPNQVNKSISLLTTGSTAIPGTGALTITFPTLSPGNYTLTINGNEQVFANAVPEPTTMCAMLTPDLLVTLRRRQRSI